MSVPFVYAFDRSAPEGGWPKITVVTATFNRASMLESAMRSVLDQGYPNLEYIVVDGGSTDASVEIIRRYENRLAWWVSEKDEGQYAAINKGFAKSSGEIMCWLNSDDLFLPWTLHTVGRVFRDVPDARWITAGLRLFFGHEGNAASCKPWPAMSASSYFLGRAIPTRGHAIQQEATFWRRELWQEAGGELDTTCTLAADFDLWARFYLRAEPCVPKVPLAASRWHAEQRGVVGMARYVEECDRSLRARAEGGAGVSLATRLLGDGAAYRLGLDRTKRYLRLDRAIGRWRRCGR
jgi:glycosyltransferase involved in cell wall biosynthesis